MKVDPIGILFQYLNSLHEIPDGAPTGDLVGRKVGDTTIYLNHSGGYRMVRDRLDRVDIEYDVYHTDRAKAAGLALLTREFLLEDLPGRTLLGVTVLDVDDISIPRYLPDEDSREHVYGGEVAIFLVESK
ncbi:hypothetical protein [Streptomyces sp. H39-S7]|uniref:hypothetical protein n=1 Tax=Streptomyces sp. H39-S7 TaxID=3004357 RepID=UPI0022AF2C27|nr:hypothetical protein [Streptomyces sp. H39-S7]MCZ4119034.1 hypothetical protein [Streptomyces sp. H39-S7]